MPTVVDADATAANSSSTHDLTPLIAPVAATVVPSSSSAALHPNAHHHLLPQTHLKWSSSEMELSNQHRIMSAAIGALLTSLVVTPFDVVKTRLQAQINSINAAPTSAIPTTAGAVSLSSNSSVASATAASCHVPRRPTASQLLLQDCSHYRLHTGLMDSWCNNCFSEAGPVAGPVAQPIARPKNLHPELRFTGALDAAAKLIKHEGISSLWRGLSPTILMSIPSTVVYFSMYDKVKLAIAGIKPQQVDRYLPGWGQYTEELQTVSPLLAGVFARACTTTLVSPIELVRTKSQSLRTSASMRSLLLSELRKGGFFSLWRGVGPTLMRDVPFSAIYWSSYEYSKLWLLKRWGQEEATPHNKSSWIYAAFLAGAGSGMMAAVVTHPFDLIKTRRQIELYQAEHATPPQSAPVASTHIHSAACSHPHTTPSSRVAPTPAAPVTSTPSTSVLPKTTWQVFKTIVSEEGYIGLASGLSARITKIAPACAIMISTYETSKMMFGETEAHKLAKAQPQRHQHVD